MLSPTAVLADTCTLINLLATGEVETLLRGLSERCLICDIGLAESLFLRDELGDRAEQRIDLSPLLHSRVLESCRAESPEEEELFVSLAAELDDGEALSLAISLVRGWDLATDDRKARRLATEIGVTALFTTQDILQFDESFDAQQKQQMIRRIETRARFTPKIGTPSSVWWSANRS